ncbi:MAG: tRNA (guanosine(46)-N(7))-methyltransferase TrmB [Sandaracinaceae bacterium]
MTETPPPIRYVERAPTLGDGPVHLPDAIEGDAPLELDIGFGRGRSFLERARQGATRVLGIEIKAKWATLVEARRARLGLANGRAVWGDARELLARAEPDGCVTRAFVHFPDPWWKKRHGKRKVLSDSFLDTLARLLRSGGELYIQTDVDDRADDYERMLEAHPAFEPVGPTYRVDGNPYGALSNREARAIEDGLPIYRLLARRP